MGYKKMDTGGEFYKWEEEGQMLEGIWLGSAGPGKYGENVAMKVNEKKVVFGLSAALRDLLMVPAGTQIKIVMTGFMKMKGGKAPMKTFDLFVEDSGTTKDQSTGVAEAAKAKADDSIPF